VRFAAGLSDALPRLISRDIFPRHAGLNERRAATRDAVDNFAKRAKRAKERDIDALRGEEGGRRADDAEETLIRAHSITRIKTPSPPARLASPSLSNAELAVSSVPLSPATAPSRSLSSSFFSALPSAFLSSRPRYRQFLSRTEGTVLASIIPTSILPWPRWKNLASGLSLSLPSSADEASPCPGPPPPPRPRLALAAPPLPVSSSFSSPLALSCFFSRL